jgi:hypothetical protein
MDAKIKNPRRHFQFRLRTLMIGVTLLAAACGYVRWRYSVVWERKAMIRHILADDHGYVGMALTPPTPLSERLPWTRRFLGDTPIRDIGLPITTSAEERAAIRAIFPGVQLMTFTEPFQKAVPFPGEEHVEIPDDGQ